MRRIRIFLTAAVLGITLTALSQPYEHAAGIRAGYSSGFTYKGFFLHRMSAIGLDVLYNPNGLNISAMYLVHAEPFRKGHWLFYTGGGPMGGTWDDFFSVGILAIAGVEYYLRDLPLTFGFDWKPMLGLYRFTHYDLIDLGFCIRYRFSL
jgi:hypothetical protein